jgi:hypothetical protein
MQRTVILVSLVVGSLLPTSCEKGLAAPQAHRRGSATEEEICIGVPAISRHEIYMVVEANRFKVQQCYRQAVKKKPKLSGKITVRFRLTDRNTEAGISKLDIDDKAFEDCVRKALETFRFPPLRYQIGNEVVVNYPFVFRPENPDGKPEVPRFRYREGKSLAVEREQETLTLILPAKAREALTRSFPDFRLLRNEDFAPGATEINLPRPFFAVANFDRAHGDDLAIALVHKERPRYWRLVAIHQHPEGYRPVLVTDFASIESHFYPNAPRRPAFFITEDARCFCERQCLAIASNIGKSFEFEWNGETYAGRLEDYLPADER